MSRRIGAGVAHAMVWLVVCALTVHAPHVESATIRQLVEVIDINDVSVSPDGRLVVFRTEQASIERNTYQTVWYVQPVDGSAPPRRLADGGDMLPDGGGSSIPEKVEWSADGKWIFFRIALDGRIGLWRAAVDGSRTEQITHDLANVREFFLSADGTKVNYSVGADREAVVDAELAEYNNGIHVDRTILPGDNLFRSGFQDGRLATQHVRNSIERVPLLADAPDRWKTLDVRTGITTELASDPRSPVPVQAKDLKGIPGETTKVLEDRRSGRIAIVTEESGGTAAASNLLLMLPDRHSRRPIRCMAEACTGNRISSISWRPGSEEILFTVSERDSEIQQSIFRWDVVSGAVRPVVRSRGQITGGGRWAPEPCAASALALLCVAAEANAPPRLERINLDSGERTVLFEPNQALGQDMQDSVPVRFVTWTDGQGRRYTGQFYPSAHKDGQPPPLFIVYYRCTGFLRGSVGDEWPLATLAGSGIAALCINAAPYLNDASERYQQGTDAIETAVQWLGGQHEIDPNRVGVGGLSFGSEVAMWTAMNSDIARAVSISSPQASPMFYLLLSLGEEVHSSRMRRYWQLGTPEETPERWKQLSVTAAMDRIHAPILMQMPEQEYRYSLDYAIPLIRQHRADLYVFPDEPHQKFQPRHKLAAYQRNLDWFRFWLLDKEDPDPKKASQYATWREMKKATNKAP